jgi:hypothetical protein
VSGRRTEGIELYEGIVGALANTPGKKNQIFYSATTSLFDFWFTLPIGISN